MEATLWRDLADFYQPELRNISGPYDRAYGMDMESYVSVVGVWMRTALAAKAPAAQAHPVHRPSRRHMVCPPVRNSGHPHPS